MFLKSFAYLVLGMEHNRQAGLQRNLVVYVTSVPDTANGGGRVFQISRVLFEPRDVSVAGALLMCQVTFKPTTPGIESVYYTPLNIERDMMKIACKLSEEDPIFFLLHLNQRIRDDIDNVYGLRTPA
ncbi:hypothetical protein PsYK624_154590 [Phanerochaete sordida]|uniref:Uncharacterized protein n=1 Tax=Phanerochaete sordida TaxID=48140 RepID=A0A9P3GT66_9APHY|nr:hypothetical protein PsYK624_154590 [Phanerochaete sordida]